ncbi:Rieske (2Fe-2S) protein [Brevibacillus agri]|uniref:Rieske (2Fe-2S) protein n=1 Tax=Brevibacillus agri TaxID=51101 RepID=UPI002E2100AA|nr:Rieske (2Fe-2S) protein [Brevibacillus agri]
MKHLVCKYEDLKNVNKMAVSIDRKSIVVVMSDGGEVYALRDVCPHKGPCLSAGMLDKNCTGDNTGEYIFEKEREVLRCPWHSWEFDIKTGRSLFDPEKVWVKTYEVTIKDDLVYVEV